ncbi:hypothetical protein BDA96_01G299200 [Sorghum bicolor]|uniref:Uncharacterized protein n=1 Tax=Sorghum bicolor TaxID=4558 RepID=A0A921S1R3_SORBI|nr:hypothetical protein BDA96_01G299200 [Sorghum bicolor]
MWRKEQVEHNRFSITSCSNISRTFRRKVLSTRTFGSWNLFWWLEPILKSFCICVFVVFLYANMAGTCILEHVICMGLKIIYG